MPTLAVTVWFVVVSKVRYMPSGFVTVVCGAWTVAPCATGACCGRTLKSGWGPANTLVDEDGAFGVATAACCRLVPVMLLAFCVTDEEEDVPPQVPVAVNGWLKTMSKCRV